MLEPYKEITLEGPVICKPWGRLRPGSNADFASNFKKDGMCSLGSATWNAGMVCSEEECGHSE